MSPSASMQNSVNSTIKKLIAEHKNKISNYDRTIEAANREIENKEKSRDYFKNLRDEAQAVVDALEDTLSKPRGQLFYFGSRTRPDGLGHFIERFEDGTTECSCEGGRYGGKCWAQDYLKDRVFKGGRQGDTSYNYDLDLPSFDARKKPTFSRYWKYIPPQYAYGV